MQNIPLSYALLYRRIWAIQFQVLSAFLYVDCFRCIWIEMFYRFYVSIFIVCRTFLTAFKFFCLFKKRCNVSQNAYLWNFCSACHFCSNCLFKVHACKILSCMSKSCTLPWYQALVNILQHCILIKVSKRANLRNCYFKIYMLKSWLWKVVLLKGLLKLKRKLFSLCLSSSSVTTNVKHSLKLIPKRKDFKQRLMFKTSR